MAVTYGRTDGRRKVENRAVFWYTRNSKNVHISYGWTSHQKRFLKHKLREVCKLCIAKHMVKNVGLKKRYGVHFKLSQKLIQMIARGDVSSQS